MTSLGSQFVAFAIMIGAGLVIGLLFDMYRVSRSLMRPRSKSSVVMDLLFWVLITPIFFAMLLAGNWGELRFYVFLGVTAGLFAYFQLISAFVLWALITGIRWFGRMCAALIYTVVRLVGWPVMIWREVRTFIWRAKMWLRNGFLGCMPHMPHMPKLPPLNVQRGAPWRRASISSANWRFMPPWGRAWPFWRK